MRFDKITREEVYCKYNGLCAYTGKPLDEKWQIDHVTSKYFHSYHELESDVNDIYNLLPAIRIINHYKREKTLESFREYMSTFHLRLAKLPKNTMVNSTKRRKEYMNTIAELFDITIEHPFSGKFYFETL